MNLSSINGSLKMVQIFHVNNKFFEFINAVWETVQSVINNLCKTVTVFYIAFVIKSM